MCYVDILYHFNMNNIYFMQSVTESVMATISQLMHTDEDQYSEDTYDAFEKYLHSTHTCPTQREHTMIVL